MALIGINCHDSDLQVNLNSGWALRGINCQFMPINASHPPILIDGRAPKEFSSDCLPFIAIYWQFMPAILRFGLAAGHRKISPVIACHLLPFIASLSGKLTCSPLMDGVQDARCANVQPVASGSASVLPHAPPPPSPSSMPAH